MNTVQEVHRAFVTIKEMMADRELHDVRQGLDGVSFEEIQQLVKSRSVFTLDVDKALRVIFHMGKFKGADVKRLLEDPFDLYLVVTREKLSSVNAKQLTDLDKQIDAFELGELLFNVTHHALVPRHTLIRDPEQIKDVVDSYRLKNKHQLPFILKTDPVVKYLGGRPGDVVRIVRASPGAGTYVLFRVVV
jgi:DNA-directed RNA polymerase subunit H (RpoH/RPB5)